MGEPVPATEFAKNFGRYRDKAFAERVVEVSSNGRPIGAYLSQDEYERYIDLRRRSAKVYDMDSLPEGLRDEFEQGLNQTEALLKQNRYEGPEE